MNKPAGASRPHKKEKGKTMKANKARLAVRLARATRAGCSIQNAGTCLVAAMLLLAAVPLGAAGPEVDGGMPGPYPVGHTSFVSTYEAGRPVAVSVWYPADAAQITPQSAEAVYVMDPYLSLVGPTTSSEWEALGYERAYEEPKAASGRFALVMFSPGLTGNSWDYLYFGTRLASHGYIVAVLEHWGDGFWRESQGAFYDYIEKIVYYRPRDLSFALTEMLRRDGSPGDLLYGTVDRRHLVAAGHSLGGYAAMTEFCGDDMVCDTVLITWWNDPLLVDFCQATPRDPRFTALLTLDGSAWILRWEELSRIHAPSLLLGDARHADGEYPDELTNNDRSWIARPHAALAAGSRSLRVDIDNLEHLSFGNPCDGYTVLRRAHLFSQQDYKVFSSGWGCPQLIPVSEPHRIITKYAIAWLNAEVIKNGSELSKSILTREYAMAHEPAVEVWWNERCCAPGDDQPGTFTYFIDMFGTCAVADQNPATDFIPYPPTGVAAAAAGLSQPMDPAAQQILFERMRKRL
jgi:hypothetical protein